MGKVSIGLRGWRFDEHEVFTDNGELKPIDEMDYGVRQRVVRLRGLIGSPCHACWLIHGDANLERCNEAAAVYGEPVHEVVLCAAHEPDFLYWFREEGGNEYRGEDELQDAFHEWFIEGGRAPDSYGGIEHVDTEPNAVPHISGAQSPADAERAANALDLENLDFE